MENASKALIIAGAILLAILLISLGIMIFNQAQDTVNNSGMTQAEISAFNNKFLKYEGTQKGSVVKSLVNDAIVNNADSNNPSIIVVLDGSRIVSPKASTSTSTSDSASTNKIVTNKSYAVNLEYTNGCVSKIVLTTN